MSTISLILISAFSMLGQQAMLQWDDVMDVDAPGQGGLRPRIALNGNSDPVVLWGRTGPSANFVSIGSASGFLSPIEVSLPGCVPSVADWMGSSIATNANTVWVVMKATPEESRPMYARRSDDGGLTWGDTIRVDPADGLVSRFPSIAVADPDAPIVQYMQFDGGWSGARQVVVRMVGAVFQAPIQVSAPFSSGEVCDCCPNQIVAEGSRVVAMHRDATSNIRVMWGASSLDGGATFHVGDVIDTTGWFLNACPSSGPDGYLDGDSIRYVWMSGANNGTKIYVGSALHEDLSLGPQRMVHPGQSMGVQQNLPRIAGSGDTLGVVWENYNAGAREILFSWSTTGPAGFGAPDKVNVDMPGNQRTPDIAFSNGTFHIVWHEWTPNQVRYRRGTIRNAVGLADNPNPAVYFHTSPECDAVFITGGNWIRAEVYGSQGSLLRDSSVRDGSVEIKALRSGAYLLRVFAADGRTAEWRFVKP